MLFSKIFLKSIIINDDKKIMYLIISGILVVLIVLGVNLMSKVDKAKAGNRVGTVSSLLAIILTMWAYNILTFVDLWIALLIGLLIGIIMSVKVKIIQMPQMVALLNGFGGAASSITGALTLFTFYKSGSYFALITSSLAIAIGGLTFSGSMLAAGKLHKILSQTPKHLKFHKMYNSVTIIISLILIFLIGARIIQNNIFLILSIIALVVVANVFGVLFTLRVGGADMPITISLLNAFSGLSGSIAGLAISDLLLVAVGGIVGASGLILTQIMCKSMNRKLSSILLGKTSVTNVKIPDKTSNESTKNVKETLHELLQTETTNVDYSEKEVKKVTQEQTNTDWLDEAKSIIIVPGYGMALGQAQFEVKQLLNKLESLQKQVRFAIHPVAGRMPGHMNVLLAEVDIPYDYMYEMDQINDDFKETDLVIVIGANDVINPAANTAVDTPIYGMPVLNVEEAKRILIYNYDDKPGYAGVDNPLYISDLEHVRLIKGNAKETLLELLNKSE